MSLSDLYVWVDAAPAARTGYVDLMQLEQCLEAFWMGTLDDVPDLSRIWLPLERLIPGNPLMSQLDMAAMRRSLYSLPELYRVAIAHHWEPESAELLTDIAHFFVHSSYQSFQQYCSDMYYQGILALAEIIYKTL